VEIVIVGMGYVGIPVAALFADVDGFNVTGVQRRSKRSGWKIDHLNNGKNPIEGEEPGLADLIKRVVEKGAFRATDDTSVYGEADAILIAVQTPVDENQLPRYESLRQVSHEIGSQLKKGTLVILESTVAPGTSENVVKPILEEQSGMKAGVDFNLIFSYERVMLGRLIHNLTKLDRIIGGITPECTRRGIELYSHIVDAKLHATDSLTAEVSKVTENTYRDVNIAFANEIAIICESLGVDVHEVRRHVNSLPHIPGDPGKNPLRTMHIPGAGVGGHCLPKDPWLLKYGLDTYGNFSFDPRLIIESRRINNSMPSHMVELIKEALSKKGINIEDAKVTLLGVAFLPNSDDTRNTPTYSLYNLLKVLCAEVIAHDPYVKEYENLEISNDLEATINGSDAIVLVTRHEEYKELSPTLLRAKMRTPVIVDGRNNFNRKTYLEAGFAFLGVGIPRE
jgi:UDP-N-acetyl-D-mannosaminuronic acid dehydrogenase|tara:strand:+ start:3869 stop:5224 length:1356 start_codon:yes stop_codon:yes gene_type:complete